MYHTVLCVEFFQGISTFGLVLGSSHFQNLRVHVHKCALDPSFSSKISGVWIWNLGVHCEPHTWVSSPDPIYQKKCKFPIIVCIYIYLHNRWYYNETNVCVECTDRDMADPTNEDCYVKPVPTPGPNPTPPGPQSGGPGLDQDPSTRAPVPTVNGTSLGSLPKPTPGKALNPQNQNGKES